MFKAGIYCRLSKDDDLQGESASISNQRELLTSVCKAEGWDAVDVYQDDGFTGLNMDRPGLQSLLADAKKGKINLVITKDLSRLGRNYLQTGHLIEDFFPRHGVRYIVLNDNIDTLVDSNELPLSKMCSTSFTVETYPKRCIRPIWYQRKKVYLLARSRPSAIRRALINTAIC